MNKNYRDLVVGALLVACAVVLPMVFHIFSQGIGMLFSPMQLPVLISAAVLPIKYSVMVAVIAPLLSSVLTGMPPLLPIAPLMALENVVYVTVFWLLLQKKSNAYFALLVAMAAGRVVYAFISGALLVTFVGDSGFVPVIVGIFAKGWPAMVLQLVVVPLFVKRIEKI
ncbi:MAG: ECF transporter S component [Negativicutes bacterium]